MKFKHLISALTITVLGIGLASCSGSKELKITEQPTPIQHKMIPEGYSFEVKVNDESLVKSYQWQYNNAVKEEEKDWDDLEGADATKAKYICSITQADEHYKEYRCAITDKNDKTIYSDSAVVYLDNKFSYVPVFYVGSDAVLAGQTLDLSKSSLGGSGKVTLNATGDEVTIENVNIDNTDYAKHNVEGSVVFEVLNYGYPFKEFKVNVVGKNKIYNAFWQPEHNSSGTCFAFNFLRQFDGAAQVCQNVLFTGEGSLDMSGGTHLIYANTGVTVDCDMNFGIVEDHYGTGIYAEEITINEGVSITGKINGYILETKTPNEEMESVHGDITIKDNAKIVMDVFSTYVSVGACVMSMISARRHLNISNANIAINELTLAERYEGKGGISKIVALNALGGNINITNSVVEARYNATQGSKSYASGAGLIIADNGYVTISDSIVSVSTDTENITGGKCIYSAKDLTITNSSVSGRVRLKGIVEGVSSNGTIKATNSKIFMDVHSYDYGQGVKGIIASGMELGRNVYVEVKSTVGIGIGIQVGAGATKREFEDDYVPRVFKDVTVALPRTSAINVYSINGSLHKFVYLETIYDSTDHTVPATKIAFYTN